MTHYPGEASFNGSWTTPAPRDEMNFVVTQGEVR